MNNSVYKVGSFGEEVGVYSNRKATTSALDNGNVYQTMINS